MRDRSNASSSTNRAASRFFSSQCRCCSQIVIIIKSYSCCCSFSCRRLTANNRAWVGSSSSNVFSNAQQLPSLVLLRRHLGLALGLSALMLLMHLVTALHLRYALLRHVCFFSFVFFFAISLPLGGFFPFEQT